jgi:putative N6-adenine-specific DNA methylase
MVSPRAPTVSESYQYQQTQRYFAQVAGGLEEAGAEELEALGATQVSQAYRGLYFDADAAALYRINYCTRLVTRTLAPLISFDCHSDRYLYKTAREVDWTAFLSPESTFAVFATVTHSKINHSKFAALRLKDAIVDDFRDRTGQRPSIDRRSPDIWLNLHIENNKAVISLDASGGSLHRRGYRSDAVEAPMQETVAAAIVRFSDWQGQTPLYDPFCGSGTLLCEALMHQARIPAGCLRTTFGFERLPDFDAALWKKVKATADAASCEIPSGLIAGSDIDPGAVAVAGENTKRLTGGDRVAYRTADFRELRGLEGSTVICNPPYGLRMGRDMELAAFYKDLGDFLKKQCSGATAYVYFGNREWIKKVGLRSSWKKPLFNGPLDGRLVKYEMY